MLNCFYELARSLIIFIAPEDTDASGNIKFKMGKQEAKLILDHTDVEKVSGASSISSCIQSNSP